MKKTKEPIYTTSWDDSGWWFINKLSAGKYTVWLSIEGEQDDDKAKMIADALNNPPLDIIISCLEGSLDVQYENDVATWSSVKRGLHGAFEDYSRICMDSDEMIDKLNKKDGL